MAQKETSSKSRRWLGLSGAAVLVANLVLTGTTIAFQQEGEVNHALGIEGAGASYGGTEGIEYTVTVIDNNYLELQRYVEDSYTVWTAYCQRADGRWIED